MTNKNEAAGRRSILQAGLGLIAAGAVTAPVAAQEKLAQELVQYQKTPKDGQRCDACVNWAPPNACNIVAGVIEPAGYCVAFAPKG